MICVRVSTAGLCPRYNPQAIAVWYCDSLYSVGICPRANLQAISACYDLYT